MSGELATRPVRLPEDEELLLTVYASTREPELRYLGWPEAEATAFVRSQFDAQTRHYTGFYPGAEHSVVLVDGEPAGRMMVDRSERAAHIVDITLLPRFRRAGVGRRLVQQLLDEACFHGLPVTCHVAAGNEAWMFWQRLGFVAVDVSGASVAMERRCETSAN